MYVPMVGWFYQWVGFGYDIILATKYVSTFMTVVILNIHVCIVEAD